MTQNPKHQVTNANRRLQRWATVLSEYYFTCKHVRKITKSQISNDNTTEHTIAPLDTILRRSKRNIKRVETNTHLKFKSCLALNAKSKK